MHMYRGIRQALVMLAVSAVVALAAAGVWSAVRGGGLRVTFAVALLAIAGLLALVGGTVVSRASTSETRAFLGMGPDREEPYGGENLTGLGVFLFVSLPLFLAGAVLYGSG
jgi:hypothetical protein